MHDRLAAMQKNAVKSIPLVDLQAQRRRLGARIDNAILRVCDHANFIMGGEVTEFERRLAEFCGARHALTCGNGTDALLLGLMAKRVGSGDAVFCPTFTFAATAEVVALAHATPVFVDVREDTFNIDPDSLVAAIEKARRTGLRPTGVIAVDLFGHPADYRLLEDIAEKHGLWIFADAAQSFGAQYRGRRVGQIADMTATSFFPSKPLGCYGDGGAIFTDDDDLAKCIDSLRVHGKGSDKYDNVRVGMNSRLDAIQAAILMEKLAIFPEELAAREVIAQRYSEGLSDVVRTPRTSNEATSAWAGYTIVTEGRDRNKIAVGLKAAAISTAIYYPLPLHQQTAYKDYPRASGIGLPQAERLAQSVLSLPMHPYLDEAAQDRVIGKVRELAASCVLSN
jgi:UDP-2-acetamido-2-deoxy-ribo-hexuluronate aminotransferase